MQQVIAVVHHGAAVAGGVLGYSGDGTGSQELGVAGLVQEMTEILNQIRDGMRLQTHAGAHARVEG